MKALRNHGSAQGTAAHALSAAPLSVSVIPLLLWGHISPLLGVKGPPHPPALGVAYPNPCHSENSGLGTGQAKVQDPARTNLTLFWSWECRAHFLWWSLRDSDFSGQSTQSEANRTRWNRVVQTAQAGILCLLLVLRACFLFHRPTESLFHRSL